MSNYTEKRSEILTRMQNLKKIAVDCKFNNVIDKIGKTAEAIQKDQFIITVVGEFNRGKSTLLNAILGEDTIPTAVRPTTATINIIHYNNRPSIKIHKSNDEIVDIGFDRDGFKQYTGLADFDPKTVKYAEVGYPVDFLKDGTVLVDTPGVNDINEQRMEITYGYMPISDATIFIFNAGTPFKQTEKDFLKDHILSNNIPTIFFILNRIDNLNEAEIKESMGSIESQLLKLFNTDRIQLFPISAKLAFKGRVESNSDLVKESRFEEFEKRLKSFILGSEKAEAKLKRMTSQVNELGVLLLDEISIQEAQLSKSLAELEELKSRLEASGENHRKTFNRLIKYIDEQKDSLITRIEGSLIKKHKELSEALSYQIDLTKGDLSDFSEKVIPHNIRQSIKQWFEQSKPFIDSGCSTISQKAIDGFIKYFSKKPILNSLMPTGNMVAETEITGMDMKSGNDVDQISKMTFAGGAAVLGVAFTVATGGLGLPVLMAAVTGGSLSQRFLGSHLAQKEFDKQKTELNKKIPAMLMKIFSGLRMGIKNNIDDYFENLKGCLNKEFVTTLVSLKDDIDGKINKFNSDQSKIESTRQMYKNAKSNITQIVK